MKIKRICILVMLFLGIAPWVAHAQSYDKLWKEVEKAEKQSLPQTVVRLTENIYRKAKTANDVPQMLKAYVWRMKYQESLTPDSFYVDLRNLEEWATRARQPVERAVLHSLIAGIYADYAQSHEWEIRGRTGLSDEDAPADIREWSGNLFVNKVLAETKAALNDSTLLLDTSTGTYVPFVELGKTSEYYHHDMYHLLVSRAIEAINTVRMATASPQLSTQIEALYRNMIAAYRKAGNADATVLTTLDYLKWKKNTDPRFRPYQAPKGLLGLTQDPYLAGLDKLIAEYKSHDVCAEVYLAKAQAAVDGGAPAQGLQICEEAIALYPGYVRINALKDLKADILRPSLSVSTAGVAYPGADLSLKVRHKNLKGFRVNLYRVIRPETVSAQREEVTAAELKKNARLVSTVHFDLLGAQDYQNADTTLSMKVPETGLYVLQMVPDVKAADLASYYLASTRFKVLTRQLPGGAFEAVALDAESGMPIADATLTIYNNKDVPLLTRTTDAEGRAGLTWQKEYAYLKATKGSDTAMPPLNLWGGDSYDYMTDNREQYRVTLLTDRSLYRPGQTVHVKGIAYVQSGSSAKVLPSRAYRLRLINASGQEIAAKELLTNEFGSFTTEFILPSVSMNGMYRLATADGSLGIRVENYKRPTFDITFDPVKDSYRLGDRIEVEGQARTYSGVPLQDLPAQYTVTRTVSRWGVWGMNSTVLASDSIRLNADGGFAIPVTLTPDEAFRNNDEVYFEYQVKVSVTNLAGETQTSEMTLRAGNRSLLLNAELPDLICKDDTIKATFQANNLNRRPVKVEGTYQLYRVTDYDREKQAKDQKTAARPALTGAFTSNVETVLDSWKSLAPGAYKLVLAARDDQGREVTAEKIIVLFSASDKRPPVYSPVWVYRQNTEFDAAHPAVFYFGTSGKDAYVMMDVFDGAKRLNHKVLNLNDSIVRFEYPYKEEYGNGLTVSFAFVKNGNLYQETVKLTKRLPDRTLTMKWDVFRDKLRPGQEEEWKLTIRTAQGAPAVAEMLATMYDASLDKIWKTYQPFRLDYYLQLPVINWIQGYTRRNYFSYSFPGSRLRIPPLSYDHFMSAPWVGVAFEEELVSVPERGYLSQPRSRGLALRGAAAKNSAVADVAIEETALAEPAVMDMPEGQDDGETGNSPEVRTNLAETAFFYPQLRTNAQGEVSFSFTMPQSLTTWNFRGYSHTKNMMIGTLDATAVTSKEFMLTPNLPRFVRVGDDASVAATIANMTGKDLNGTVRLVLFDPLTEKVITTQKQKFAVTAGQTIGVTFRFPVTDKYTMLGCRLVADAGTFSDGEQQAVPVLSNKENITETIALTVNGDTTRVYSLDNLFNHHSPSATGRRLTVEMTGNPAWYAVQSLPSLAQPRNDDAISWATVLYANTLASYIANANPKIKAVFDGWKQQGGTKESLLSNLQKNQELKNILLQESPWVLEATTEQEQKERLATLFDVNNIAGHTQSALLKLKELQLADGSWPWYRGMSGNRAVTEYIVELTARLFRLTKRPLDPGVQSMQQAAFGYLHKEAQAEYRSMLKAEKQGQKVKSLPAGALKYLYLITFSHEKVPAANQAAVDYFKSKLPGLLATQTPVEKAYSAIVLYGQHTNTVYDFLESLTQHLVETGEGLTLAPAGGSYAGPGSQIAAQVAVMEAYLYTQYDLSVIEKMKVWLLNQKRTQQWDSPVATADAVFALLYYGKDLLESRGDVRVVIGNSVVETLSPAKTTVPGLGYVKETFTDKKVVDARKLTVEKRDAGLAWGAVYAQYEEDIDKVSRQGGELSVDRKLYVEKMIGTTPQLQPLTLNTHLAVGDKVVSRLTIRVDRAMDFVQLKDGYAACLEPVDQLSGYRRDAGTGYYVAVNDASANFFFDRLAKGVYVLEYSYRVSRIGTYETGLATIQSAYAPGYAAHTASVQVKVE